MSVGRPKGLPRTGGRKAGTPNKVTADVRAQAQKYGPKALKVLAEIMEGTKQPPAARVSAARELLDRAYGKPAQPISPGDGDLSDLIGRLLDRQPA